MDVPQQYLQRFRLQRMDRPRQSFPRAPEEGRNLQHLPAGVFISWRKVFCRCCHPYPSVSYRRGGGNGSGRGGCAQDQLRMVGLWRAERVGVGRKKGFLYGSVFRKHQSQERLLPLWGNRWSISGRSKRMWRVGPVCPFPAGHGIFSGADVEEKTEQMAVCAAVVPVCIKR